MNIQSIHLLLADDDFDDCLFFKEALESLPVNSTFEMVNNGDQLIDLLNRPNAKIPDILFLDLNMPRKNGIECLSEIKQNNKLKSLPVIIYSTSFEPAVIDLLFEKGADRYIRKPVEFVKLKIAIQEALALASKGNFEAPSKENFVIEL